MRSPSRRYSVGVVRDRPDLRPVVVISAAGNHSILEPSRPLVRRYTQMWALANRFSATSAGLSFGPGAVSRAPHQRARIHGSQITIGITWSVHDL